MKFTTNRILIAAILCVSAVSCYLLTSERVLAFDDLLYGFVFCEDFYDVGLLKHIETFGDVVESQIFHYLDTNGRTPAQFTVQLFDGLWGLKAYGIANSIVYIIFILLITRYLFRSTFKTNPLPWLIVALTVQFLFPGGPDTALAPWFSLSFGVNYLWAGALYMFILTIWNRNANFHSGAPYLVAICILGIICGWMNEAFSLPLCGGFVLACLIRRQLPSKANILLLAAIIIGTAITVFSPGTMTRVSDHSGAGAGSIIISLAECYLDARLIWIFVIALIILVSAKRLSFKEFAETHLTDVCIWISAVVLSLYAHTYRHSLTVVELMSFILLVKALRMSKLNLTVSKRVVCIISLVGIAGYAVMIYAIVNANIRVNRLFEAEERAFVESPDGVFVSEYPDDFFSRHFVSIPDMHLNPRQYCATAFAVKNGVRDRIPLALSPRDYNSIIENPDSFFVEENKVPGSANFYEGEDLYFSKIIPECAPEHIKITAMFEGKGFMKSLPAYRRFVYHLLGDKKAPKPIDFFIVSTRSGKYLVGQKHLSTPSSIELTLKVAE